MINSDVMTDEHKAKKNAKRQASRNSNVADNEGFHNIVTYFFFAATCIML